jgi:hypothetical protein
LIGDNGLQISVIDLSTNRSIRLEVEPHHTLGSVLETVVNGLGLPRNRPYSLVLGGKELGSGDYSRTLAARGVKDGDQFELLPRPPGGM